MLESLFKKVECLESLLKETRTQVFSCEYCETFKNSFFYRTPLMAASGIENIVCDTYNPKFYEDSMTQT